MKELFKALKNKVDYAVPSYNSFYTSIGGRFYNTRSPQNQTFPYAVFHLINDLENSTFTELMDVFTIQISIFSKPENQDSGEICTVYENLKDLFDDSNLSISGYDNFDMHRQFSRLMWISEEEVWQYVIEYELETNKQ